MNYFRLNGNSSWDQNQGIITLTQNKTFQVGSYSLRNRVNFGNDFLLSGEIYSEWIQAVYDYSMKVEGNPQKAFESARCDGLGLAFHQGSTQSLGFNGGYLGIAGLPDAIGWILDTYTNSPDRSAPWPYMDYDPANSIYTSFAGTNANGYMTRKADSVVPNVSAGDSQWHPFTMSYSASNRLLIVEYDHKKSQTIVPTSVNTASMAMSASNAGGDPNGSAQQFKFKLDKFIYSSNAKPVLIKYENEKNEEIHDEDQLSGDLGEAYDTSSKKMNLENEGYTFDPTVGNETGNFSNKTNEVTYVYKGRLTSDQIKLPSLINFGSHEIQYESEQTCYGEDSGGMPVTGMINLLDTRSVKGEGFKIKVMQDESFKGNQSKKVMDLASLAFDTGTISNSQGNKIIGGNQQIELIPGADTEILHGLAGQTGGKTEMPISNFTLNIPKEEQKYKDKYQSRITWTLSDTP